jgi:hypothetical protein
MKTFAFALLSVLSLAAAPAFADSATPAGNSAEKGVQLALDVRIGEGGVRIDGDRDHDRDRYRDRRRYRVERESECRTVVTREYRGGEVYVRKVRRCY